MGEAFFIEFIANFGDRNEGADGIAFVFQKDPRSYSNDLGSVIGQPGVFIGYGSGDAFWPGGMTKQIALEFDTYDNLPHGFDDTDYDHFDIRRGSDMRIKNNFYSGNQNQKIKLVDVDGLPIDVENGKDIQIQILWIPGDPNIDITKGTLVVYFNCYKIFDDTNFDIDEGTGWSNLDNVFFGLTAATANEINYHRVFMTSPNELILEQKDICGNVQLNARYPELCGNVQFEWKNVNTGTTEGLINPNAKNPIAFKSGTYECKATIIASAQEWLPYVPATITETIVVDIRNKIPEYSYRKLYGNQYLINNEYIDVYDGVCGSILSDDCGFMVSSFTYFRPEYPENNNSASMWLFKTDYAGNLIWTKNYIAALDGLDVNSLYNTPEGADYRFFTVSHYAINDYQLLNSENFTCNNLISDYNNSVIYKRIGYLISGEFRKPYTYNPNDNIDPKDIDIFFLKINKEGEINSSIALDVIGKQDKAVKTLALGPNKYMSLCRSDIAKNNYNGDGAVFGFRYDYS